MLSSNLTCDLKNDFILFEPNHVKFIFLWTSPKKSVKLFDILDTFNNLGNFHLEIFDMLHKPPQPITRLSFMNLIHDQAVWLFDIWHVTLQMKMLFISFEYILTYDWSYFWYFGLTVSRLSMIILWRSKFFCSGRVHYLGVGFNLLQFFNRSVVLQH